MRHKFKILLIINLSGLVLINSCAMLGLNDEAKPKDVVVVDNQGKEIQDATKMKTNPSVFSEVSECVPKTVPEMVLSLGMTLAVSGPLVPVVAASFYGTSQYRCIETNKLLADGQTKQDKALSEAVADARRKTAAELKATFDKMKDKIESREEGINASIADLQRKLNAAGESERLLIEKTSSRAIRDLYNEIEKFKKGVKIKVSDEEDGTLESTLDGGANPASPAVSSPKSSEPQTPAP